MTQKTGKSAGRYSLTTIPGTDIALFHLRGPVSLADREAHAERMVAFCRVNGTNRLLIDGREQELRTD